MVWSAARRPLAFSLLAGAYAAALGLAGWAGYAGGTHDHPTLVRAWAQSAPTASGRSAPDADTGSGEAGKGGEPVASAPVASPAPGPVAVTSPPPVSPTPPAATQPVSPPAAATPPAPAATPTPTPAAKKPRPVGPPKLFEGEGRSDDGRKHEDSGRRGDR
jgi:hypothetical protein